MIQEGKIGAYEIVSLITISFMSKFFFVMPTWFSQVLGTAICMGIIVSGLTSIIAFYFICLLMKRFPGKSLVEILQKVFGTIIGKTIIILISIYGIAYTAITLREFNDVLKTITLPSTPISVIFIVCLLAMVILSCLGLESLARTASFFSIALLIGLIAVYLLSAASFRPHRFFPLFGYGLDKIFYYGIWGSSSFIEIFLLAFFVNSLGGIKNLEKIGYISIIISTISILLGFTIYTLLSPYYTRSEVISAAFHIVRTINLGKFFQRFEAIFLFEWILSGLFCLSLYFYFMVTLFAKAFSLNDYRPLLIPYAVLIFTTALLPPDFSFIVYKAIPFKLYAWIPFCGVPFLALITAVIRKQKEDRKHT